MTMNDETPPPTRRGRGRPPKKSTTPETESRHSASTSRADRSTRHSPSTSRADRSSHRRLSASPSKAQKAPPFKHITTVYESHGQQIFGCCFNQFSVDTQPYFATVGSNRISIYAISDDPRPITLLRNFKDPCEKEAFYAVAWAYCNVTRTHYVVAAGLRGMIRVVEPISGSCTNTLMGHGEPVNELRVHPVESRIIASAGKDFTVRLWNINLSQCIAILGGVAGHLDQVLSMDFDGRGKFLVSASMDHTVKVWAIGEGTGVLETIRESFDPVKFDGRCLGVHFPIASSRDLHTNYVDCVRLFDTFIFSKSSENAIVLWKFGEFNEDVGGRGTLMRTETSVTQMAYLDLPEAEVWFIKFAIDPRSKYLVSGNEIGELHVWNLDDAIPNDDRSFTLRAPKSEKAIRQVAFSQCGKYMVTVGDDSGIARWDRIG